MKKPQTNVFKSAHFVSVTNAEFFLKGNDKNVCSAPELLPTALTAYSKEHLK